MAQAIPLINASFGRPKSAPTDYSNVATTPLQSQLTAYIRSCFEAARDHRQQKGIDERMIAALRTMRGEYDPEQAKAIAEFGGSQVYARITSSKVRGMSAFLREIYTASERPWVVDSSPSPDLPGPAMAEVITNLLMAEQAEMVAAGMPPPPQEMIEKRANDLRDRILAQRKKASNEALRERSDILDDLLWEGGFYAALWEFLGDFALFPYAVIKGPVVRMKSKVVWKDKIPTQIKQPTMVWERCSPFDVYFAPWAANVNDGYIIHRTLFSRRAMQAMIGVPGYRDQAIRAVLAKTPSQLQEWVSYCESERADLETRETTETARIGQTSIDRPFPALEFAGSVSAKMLRDWGSSAESLGAISDDEDLEVHVTMVAGEIIGVRRNPHPDGHKGFYVDSFEKVPGSVIGNGVPDLISDVQDVANATLRALVNNVALAAGPQIGIREDLISPNQTDLKIHPFKLWRLTSDMYSPQNGAQLPVQFFQPESNAQELLGVYQSFAQMADELSSLPRYMSGQSNGLNGVGRTAAGLSMLMNAADRTVKQAVSSVDSNILEKAVEHLNVFLALTRPDLITAGDLTVTARGATELVQRETLRMRRLEFLNITNNPVDMQLVGPGGRTAVLREIARDLNLPVDETVPGVGTGPAGMPGMQQGGMPGAPASPSMPGGAPQMPEAGGAPPNPTQGIAAGGMNPNPGM